MQIKESDFFKICDRVDASIETVKSKYDREGGAPYFPTVEDLEEHNVEENLKKYLPYLIFLDNNPFELEGEDVSRTITYIRKLFQKNLKLVN